MCEDLIWATQRLSHIIQQYLSPITKCFTLEPRANNLRMKAHYGDPFCVVTYYYFFEWSFLNLNPIKSTKEVHNVFSYYGRA
jgi:hypothetical protein